MNDYMAWYSRISRRFIGLVNIEESVDSPQQSTSDVDEVGVSTQSSKVKSDGGDVDYSLDFNTYWIFENIDGLYQWVGDTGKKLGFVSMIAKSNSEGQNRRGNVWFRCGVVARQDLKKIPSADEHRGSKKYGCSF